MKTIKPETGRPTKTTPETRNAIRSRWASRFTMKKLCAEYGICRFTAYQIIRAKMEPETKRMETLGLMHAINEADRKNGRRLSFPKIAA